MLWQNQMNAVAGLLLHHLEDSYDIHRSGLGLVFEIL
jgi:hypothetical protein